jgi:hypothetical protein
MTPGDMRQPQLLKECRERGITHLKDGTKIDRTAKREPLLEALGFPAKKKGRATWKPAQKLQVHKKDPGFRYRWRENDAQNIQRAVAEGWEFVNPITGIPGEHQDPGDGQQSLTSTTEYRELKLMALPEEKAQARDEYFQERTDIQTTGLKDRFQDDLDNEAQRQGGYKSKVSGKITID